MMAHLATAHSICGKDRACRRAVDGQCLPSLDSTGVAAVCLIYLDGASQSHMRYTIKRLRRKMPNGKIILCCWAEGIYRETLLQRRVDAKADFGAATPSEALTHCVREASAADASARSSEQPPLAIAN